MKSNFVEFISKLFIATGLLILSWNLLVYLSNFILLIFGFKINKLTNIFSIGFVIVSYLIYSLKRNKKLLNPKLVLSSLFLVLITVFFAYYISYSTYDLSYDGQGYHQQAILNLSNGWNPYYESLTYDQTKSTGNIYSERYPKALWFVQSAFYSLTHNIDLVRFINLLIIFGCFYYSIGVGLLIKKIKKWTILVVCLFAFLNPITIGQSLGILNDHVSFALLFASISSLIHMFMKKELEAQLIFISICIFVINIKFTNLIYVICFGIFSAFILFLLEEHSFLFKFIRVFIISLFLSVFIFGANPYIKNVFDKWDIFYSNDSTMANVPGNLLRKPLVERFIYGIFSKSIKAVNSDPDDHIAVLKIPFSFDQSEIDAFYTTNIRAGGFGPWFGGTLLLSLLFLSIFIYIEIKKKTANLNILLILLLFIGLCFGISIIFPINNLARFIPLVWLIPLTILLLVSTGKSPLLIIISTGIICICVIGNLILVSIGYFKYQINTGIKLSRQITEFRNISSNKELLFRSKYFIPMLTKFQNNNINIKMQTNENCLNFVKVEGSYNSSDVCIEY